MDYNSSYIFLRVAQNGSFSKTARQMNLPLSTVSAKVAQLEKYLGLTLLKRTTRKLSLTPVGEIYYRQAQKAFDELIQAERLTKETQMTLQGRIKLTAPVEIGTSHLTDVLATFIKRHPQIHIELLLTDRLVDLVGENIDLAIRIGSLKDSTLKSKRLGFTNQKVYASPEYLKAHAQIKVPKDLSQHSCLIFTNSSKEEWILESDLGREKVQVQGAYSANNLMAIHRMALHGQGLALLPEFLCFEDLKSKKLIPVLPDWSTQKSPVHVVYANQNYITKSLRAVIEHLTQELTYIF